MAHLILVDHTLVDTLQESLLDSATPAGIVGQHIARLQRHAVALGIHIGAVFGLYQRVTVGRHVEVVKFVTHQFNRQQRTIGLRHLCLAAVSRDSKCLNTHKGCQQQQRNSQFPHYFL